MQKRNCRFCGNSLNHTFCDLGISPFSNAYLKLENLQQQELVFPLHAFVCDQCFLVQLEEFQAPHQIFEEYAYFSSYSESWLKHAKHYVEEMCLRFSLDSTHQVIEIASNDGYLLKYFKDRSIPVLGIEPARNVASVAENQGIPTLTKFFGSQTAQELIQQNLKADLLLGNNVLAHVPNLNDFVYGMKLLLKPHGIITMEFPHLLRLMEENQFDTIYHEHFSYFSFLTVEKIFAKHGLTLFDVEQLATHGGSLRIFAKHTDDDSHPIEMRVTQLKNLEKSYGLDQLITYQNFSRKVLGIKEQILGFLQQCKASNQEVAGYGAPAKGNTLLNYCGIKPDLLKYTVDLNPYKQGKFLPGTHIPIKSPDFISKAKPAYLLILPWNLKHEIIHQMAHIREWGGKFVIPIPKLEIIP